MLFLATANVVENIPSALLDRMELVTLDGYTEDDKVAIARDYLLPRQLERAALDADEVAELLRIKKGSAYEVIRKINAEQEARGRVVIRGRVRSDVFDALYFPEVD